MMASVSSAARVYRGGFSGCSRSRYSRIWGLLWKRQPLATVTSSSPRGAHSCCSSASNRRRVSAPSSSANSTRMSRSVSGEWEQSKAVSRTRLACAVFMMQSSAVGAAGRGGGQEDGSRTARFGCPRASGAFGLSTDFSDRNCNGGPSRPAAAAGLRAGGTRSPAPGP